MAIARRLRMGAPFSLASDKRTVNSNKARGATSFHQPSLHTASPWREEKQKKKGSSDDEIKDDGDDDDDDDEPLWGSPLNDEVLQEGIVILAGPRPRARRPQLSSTTSDDNSQRGMARSQSQPNLRRRPPDKFPLSPRRDWPAGGSEQISCGIGVGQIRGRSCTDAHGPRLRPLQPAHPLSSTSSSSFSSPFNPLLQINHNAGGGGGNLAPSSEGFTHSYRHCLQPLFNDYNQAAPASVAVLPRYRGYYCAPPEHERCGRSASLASSSVGSTDPQSPSSSSYLERRNISATPSSPCDPASSFSPSSLSPSSSCSSSTHSTEMPTGSISPASSSSTRTIRTHDITPPFREARAVAASREEAKGASLGRKFRKAVSHLALKSPTSTSSSSMASHLDKPLPPITPITPRTTCGARQPHDKASQILGLPDYMAETLPANAVLEGPSWRVSTDTVGPIDDDDDDDDDDEQERTASEHSTSSASTPPSSHLRTVGSCLSLTPSLIADCFTCHKLESVLERSEEEEVRTGANLGRVLNASQRNDTESVASSYDSSYASSSTSASSTLASSSLHQHRYDTAAPFGSSQRTQRNRAWRDELCRSLSYHNPFIFDLDAGDSNHEDSFAGEISDSESKAGDPWPDEPLEFPIGEASKSYIGAAFPLHDRRSSSTCASSTSTMSNSIASTSTRSKRSESSSTFLSLCTPTTPTFSSTASSSAVSSPSSALDGYLEKNSSREKEEEELIFFRHREGREQEFSKLHKHLSTTESIDEMLGLAIDSFPLPPLSPTTLRSSKAKDNGY